MADDKTWAGLPRKTLKLALPTLAALGAGGAIAVAAIPSAGGTIHGCYATGTDTTGAAGRLRVIDESASCPGGEQPISWNQQGPQGAQGNPGSQGPKGDQGNKGDQGVGTTTAPATPAAQAFLTLDGIPGGSTEPGHGGQIDVRSFSWGLSNNASSSSGGGGGTAKAKFRNLTFTKTHDRASAKLFTASASGKHIKTATFFVVKDGQEVIRYKLSDVLVKSFSTSDGFLGLTENVALAPVKVEFSFNDNGTALTSSWNVHTNTKKPVINSFSFKSPTP